MAMNFRSAGDRVRSLVAAKKPGQLSRSALTPDALRDNIIEENEARTPRLQSLTNSAPEVSYTLPGEDDQPGETKTFQWDGYGEAVRDVARASYGYDSPELLRQDKIRPSHQFNREVLSNLLSGDEFEESYPYTRGNEVESMYGAMKFAQTLREKAPEVAEHIARAQQMGEAEQEVDSAEAMLERLRERAKEEKAQTGEVHPDTKREVKQQVKKRQAGKEALKQAIQAHLQSNHATAASQVAQAAGEAMKEAADVMGSLPGMGGGHSHNLSPDTQIALAEKWAANEQLRKVLQMLGRMVTDFRFKRETRTKNVKIEPVGITTGNDLSLQVPHELARAHMPALRPLWIKDYAERSLLEWQMEGKQRAAKGPIIEIHDGSGSMSGEKFVWATSLALTLATGAMRERRDFAGIEFGSAGQVKAWTFLKNDPPDPDKLLDFATHFYAGGTSTVGGFEEALRIMRTYPQFESADIILVGDGLDRFGDRDRKVRDELKALNVRIHGITILTPNNPYFAQMCDWHTDVQDLAGPNGATDALAEQIT